MHAHPTARQIRALNQNRRDVVCGKRVVRGNDGKSLDFRLSDDKAVERIAMILREQRYGVDVRSVNVQQLKTLTY
jgi:hypothetical protein